jgi:hypothetical protein
MQWLQTGLIPPLPGIAKVFCKLAVVIMPPSPYLTSRSPASLGLLACEGGVCHLTFTLCLTNTLAPSVSALVSKLGTRAFGFWLATCLYILPANARRDHPHVFPRYALDSLPITNRASGIGEQTRTADSERDMAAADMPSSSLLTTLRASSEAYHPA